MTYPTEGGPKSVFVTATLQSADLGRFLNGLVKEYGTSWDTVNISTTNDGYVTYVTYRVDQPKDRAPARAFDIDTSTL